MQKAGITLNCVNCGKPFYVASYRAETGKYCKWECKQAVEKLDSETKTRKRWFFNQRDAAKSRGIGWNLTFDEWLDIWVSSGHFAERGQARNQYCMARYGDKGKYEIGNVRIITVRENIEERYSPRGAENGYSKLTDQEVLEIRALESKLCKSRQDPNKYLTREMIAEEYGIDVWHVRDLQKRKAWAWLEDKPPDEHMSTFLANTHLSKPIPETRRIRRSKP